MRLNIELASEFFLYFIYLVICFFFFFFKKKLFTQLSRIQLLRDVITPRVGASYLLARLCLELVIARRREMAPATCWLFALRVFNKVFDKPIRVDYSECH